MVKLLIKSGAAGVHIEDQIFPKRCGHRPAKQLVSTTEMVDRLKAAIDARTEPDFVIMARTDAIAAEGVQGALERAQAYVEAGADMIFAEAVKNLEDYRIFVKGLTVPVLANITEFGQTPLFTVSELQSVGIQLALYPLSAFRAMSQAALSTYKTIRQEGTQTKVLALMQTREALYQILHYTEFERLL
jgi:methylisocitrate lyase